MIQWSLICHTQHAPTQSTSCAFTEGQSRLVVRLTLNSQSLLFNTLMIAHSCLTVCIKPINLLLITAPLSRTTDQLFRQSFHSEDQASPLRNHLNASLDLLAWQGFSPLISKYDVSHISGHSENACIHAQTM